MPSLRTGKTVTLVHRQVTGRDSYGNDIYGTTEKTVEGCAVSPGNSSEDWQGTEQITADITVHMPPGTVVDMPLDQVIVDGTEYNVVGDPRSWSSPFTGTQSFLEVQGRLITTGGAAT